MQKNILKSGQGLVSTIRLTPINIRRAICGRKLHKNNFFKYREGRFAMFLQSFLTV